ncbi:MAG TPA: hypothetical protein VJM50_24015 [Pyrinomonadaceae bacterium]|nr:hypothetical protein [Pyrinomonadaceae bacterium]
MTDTRIAKLESMPVDALQTLIKQLRRHAKKAQHRLNDAMQARENQIKKLQTRTP